MAKAKTKFSPEPYRRQQEQRRIIGEARKVQEQEKQKLREWATNNSEFDVDEYLAIWESRKKDSAKRFVAEIITAMSVYDGVMQANDLATIGMGMRGVEIDLDVIKGIEQNVFMVKLAEILVREANLNQEAARSIISRVIAQVFPVREMDSSFLIGDKSEGSPIRREHERRNNQSRRAERDPQERRQAPEEGRPRPKFRI